MRFASDLFLFGSACAALLVLTSNSSSQDLQRAAADRVGTPLYRLTDLGALGGGPNSYASAWDISEGGSVVGHSNGPAFPRGRFWCSESHAFLWLNGHMLDLSTMIAEFSSATGVNASNQVVGSSASRAFLWESGTMAFLPDFGGSATAAAINDAGRIVGMAINAQGRRRPVLWDGQTIQDLGTLPDGLEGWANDITEKGLIVGMSRTGGGEHAVAWQADTIIDLGVLNERIPFSAAQAANDVGQVVGHSYSFQADNAVGVPRAVLWSNGTIQELGSLDGFAGIALDINEQGWIVGQSGFLSSFHSGHAFLWVEGQMINLNNHIDPEPALTLRMAAGITEDGRIVGTASCPQGIARGFLLTPIR